MTDKKRKITVQRSRKERYSLRVIMAVYFLMILSLSVLYGWLLMVLLAIPGGLFGLLLLWYEGWSVTFRGDVITYRIWFRDTETYSLQKLADAVQGYSATDQEYVSMYFSDGRKLVIRRKDENGDEAIKLVRKRHSIRILN